MHNRLDQHLKFIVNTFYNQDQATSLEDCWGKVLIHFFPDGQITRHSSTIDTTRLSDNNSSLFIPVLNSDIHFELKHTDKNIFFSDQDLNLVNSLFKLTQHFVTTREAIEQGANEERQRIARDLHDDVAARLLTLIHQVKDDKTIELVRSILKSLRNAIYTLDNRSTTTILDAITDIRAEIQYRLNQLGIQLIWQQPDNLEQFIFTPRQHINLHRILHEIVTNIIRHANASYMHIDIDLNNEWIYVSVVDNGTGFDINNCVPGKGIHNIKNRAKELDGNVNWTNNPDPEMSGCTININFPIQL
ncbi:MAG: hypothetical protein OEZ38_08395 [Gammaproteobacteria bacterium]|nr:hypothetical protein [Gammaproteobacteria bacterium]